VALFPDVCEGASRFFRDLLVSIFIKWSASTSRAQFILQHREGGRNGSKPRTINQRSWRAVETRWMRVQMELHLLGVVDTLHVGRGDAGARQRLPRVLLVAFQNLTLQVTTHRLDVETPETHTQVSRSSGIPFYFSRRYPRTVVTPAANTHCLYHSIISNAATMSNCRSHIFLSITLHSTIFTALVDSPRTSFHRTDFVA